MNKIMLAVTALIIGIASPGAAVAETAKDFVGSWTLVSAITEQDGKNQTPLALIRKAFLYSTPMDAM